MHDTHHPVGSGLYYEDQKPEALRRAQDFRKNRLPKFLDYFERLARPKSFTYLDLSLFQMVEGLRYAFPRTMQRELRISEARGAARARGARPRLAAYLASRAPHCVQRAGHLPALPRAGRGLVPIGKPRVCALRWPHASQREQHRGAVPPLRDR